jgi:CheY-like chemotaxis protein
MPAGGVIEIRAENAGGPDLTDLKPPSRTGKFVRISIRDHGMGIPPEHLPRIFDPYFTTKQKGSGLGLTTAYSIIKRHDGRISVDSKVGSGTVFTITLPATAERRRKPAREHEMITAQKGRILVMDDDLLVRSVAMEILGRLGYEAETCADGAEMIKRYTHAFGSKQPFDAVIMDLTVQGGMGGKEAINKLKAVDPAVKAIVSSGYSNDPIMSDYRKFGFSGVIGKPYTIRDMADTVRSVIGGNRKKKKS